MTYRSPANPRLFASRRAGNPGVGFGLKNGWSRSSQATLTIKDAYNRHLTERAFYWHCTVPVGTSKIGSSTGHERRRFLIYNCMSNVSVGAQFTQSVRSECAATCELVDENYTSQLLLIIYISCLTPLTCLAEPSGPHSLCGKRARKSYPVEFSPQHPLPSPQSRIRPISSINSLFPLHCHSFRALQNHGFTWLQIQAPVQVDALAGLRRRLGR